MGLAWLPSSFRNGGFPAFFPLLRLLAVLSFLSLCSNGAVGRNKNKDCYYGKGRRIRNVAGFQVKVEANPDWEDFEDDPCRAVVLDSQKKIVFSTSDHRFSIEVAGRDVNGDSIPDVVIAGFSGGAHCCWTYYFISLGAEPKLLLKFENERDAAIYEDEHTKRIYFGIQDGAFDYFDGLCHACTPFPLVFFRLEGKRLVDISSEFTTDYDDIVKESKAALKNEDLAAIAAMVTKPTETPQPETRDAVERILTIVFAYLYSGRENQARQELQAMWPKFDQDRMWGLIQEQRREGILRYVYGAGDAPAESCQR